MLNHLAICRRRHLRFRNELKSFTLYTFIPIMRQLLCAIICGNNQVLSVEEIKYYN